MKYRAVLMVEEGEADFDDYFNCFYYYENEFQLNFERIQLIGFDEYDSNKFWSFYGEWCEYARNFWHEFEMLQEKSMEKFLIETHFNSNNEELNVNKYVKYLEICDKEWLVISLLIFLCTYFIERLEKIYF